MEKLIPLFISFLKVGIFGFGGGASMALLVQEEVVDVHGWLTNAEFVEILAMGNSLPGPIIVKLAVFIGFKESSWIGAVAAVLAVSMPGIIGMLALGALFLKFKDHPRVQGLFYGIRPIVIAMLAVLIYSLFPKSVIDWKTGMIMVSSFAIMAFLNVHPLFMILAGGILGIMLA